MKDYIAETKKCLEGYKENKEMLESKMKLLNRLKEENKSSERETGITSIRYYLSRLDMALEEIKPVWKEILVLKYIENNTCKYTERKVGLSESTCKRYANEGIKAMADKIVGQKSYVDLPLFRDIYIGEVI